MRKVLVTGADGFIGKNLCAMLDRDSDITILRYTRENKISELRDMISEADFVFHLAGVNRPKDDNEFDSGNRELTELIVGYMSDLNKDCSLLLTSSTQAELDNPYGHSKLAAEKSILEWANHKERKAYIYRLPGVFGKWCKPKYNSVVATFCSNIAHDEAITINDPNKVLTLVYIDDVVEEFLKALHDTLPHSKTNFYQVQPEYHVSLGEIADRLNNFKTRRQLLEVPDFSSDFDKALYATYTSYFVQEDFCYALDKKTDERGWLAEFIKSESFGQIYVSQTNPGYTRGIHWHNTKIEKFIVIKGEAEIKLRHKRSGEVHTIKVSEDSLKVVEMPAGYVHSITNTGSSDMYLLIWSQQVFDPDKPDTFHEQI